MPLLIRIARSNHAEDRWVAVFSLSGEQNVAGGGECVGCPVLYVQDPSDWLMLGAVNCRDSNLGSAVASAH